MARNACTMVDMANQPIRMKATSSRSTPNSSGHDARGSTNVQPDVVEMPIESSHQGMALRK